MRLFLVEKLAVVENGVQATLSGDLPECQITSYESIEQVEMLKAGRIPDMILISLLSFTGGEGVHQVVRAKKLFPRASIIAYGSDPLPDSISMYYNAGLNGYCSLEGQDLINCIKTVAEGKTYFTSSMVEYFVFQLQANSRTSGARPLTSRQYQIAYYLAKGMSVTLIAKRLGLGASTVSTFKIQIFKKLGIQSIVELPAKLNISPR